MLKKELEIHKQRVKEAEEWFVELFVAEVQRRMRNLEDDWELITGMGCFYFNKNGESCDKLPQELQDVIEILEDHDFILRYIGDVK